jgi:NAD(P)H-hydrate epimerase
MKHSADFLYSTATIRELEQLTIHEYEISGYDMMNRAGRAALKILQQKFKGQRLLVCCGGGNNGGDGYVLARLAQRAGYVVDVVSLVDPLQLKGDALRAYEDWRMLGLGLIDTPERVNAVDVVVDALLGTGLQREVEGVWRNMIEAINDSGVPVLSLDVPSGLNADTGCVMGVAVCADVTVSFVGHKRGMFTHQAVDCCGDIILDDLDLPQEIFQRVSPRARKLDWPELQQHIHPRRRSCHKGNCGHVLIIGGNTGMSGAVRLAGEAALRAGAGLVSVVTRPGHVSALVSARPELMVWGSDDARIPADVWRRASVVVIGPGLGRDVWAQQLLAQVLADTSRPKVIDADALNLLHVQDGPREDWVLTPHPGEAARMLACTSADIQQDRFAALENLLQKYGGTIVLKGAGSVLGSGGELPAVCPYGNPGMATAGMGDVLSGIIAAWLAQRMNPVQAAQLGVVIHALAGDAAAQHGERGLLASDLFEQVRTLVNANHVH